MKVLGGDTEAGITAGNVYNKYESRNPIARILQNGFERNILDLLKIANPASIHEAGCGEGYWTLRLSDLGYNITGSDFSQKAIDAARENCQCKGLDAEMFTVNGIYDLPPNYGAEMMLCLEVFEHLKEPEKAIAHMATLSKPWLLCSVPNEPVWSLLNMVRGKYWGSLGNTPGHLQRFRPKKFLKLLANHFEIAEVRKPLPWTIALCKKK